MRTTSASLVRGFFIVIADDDIAFSLGMLENTITDLVGKVESQSVFLEYIDDPEALFVMPEAARIEGVEDLLAGVAEGCVTEIVSQRYGLHEVFIERQGPANGPCYLRDLEGMGQPRAIVVPGGQKEDLCLVFEPSEGLAVRYPVPVMLEGRPYITLRFRANPSARSDALLRVRRQDQFFPFFQSFADIHSVVTNSLM